MNPSYDQNILIARFIGIPIDSSDTVTAFRIQKIISRAAFDDPLEKVGAYEMEFHTSWDWLMPVIQKIKEVYFKLDSDELRDLIQNMDGHGLFESYNCFLVDPSFNITHKAVLDFIEKYNTL